MQNNCNYLKPNWNAPQNVVAFTTLRSGGTSQIPYHSFNLAAHVGDDTENVVANRKLLKEQLNLPSNPLWLLQVHGIKVAEFIESKTELAKSETIEADASVAFKPNQICVVLTADCLPILICDKKGTRVSAIHAGWRGLAKGVIEAAIEKLNCDPKNLLAWLGPAIGPQSFEVKQDVLDHFPSAQEQKAFVVSKPDHFLADIYQLATIRLQNLGITQITGGGFCTYREEDRFFSYRKANPTGRMATLIWLKN